MFLLLNCSWRLIVRVIIEEIFNRFKNATQEEAGYDQEIVSKGIDVLLIGSGSDRIVMEWLRILREYSEKRIGYFYCGGRYAFYCLKEDLCEVREAIEETIDTYCSYYETIEFPKKWPNWDGPPTKAMVSWYNDHLELCPANLPCEQVQAELEEAGVNVSSEIINSWSSFQKGEASTWATLKYLKEQGMQRDKELIMPEFLKSYL